MEEVLITKSENYKRSESIIELSKSLCKMQSELLAAPKDSNNSYFKSKYADLATVWEACRKPLTTNGLSIVQFPTTNVNNVNNVNIVTITTMLLHVSGEYITSDLTVEAKDGSPQAVGSAVTYVRRYSMSSILGICSEEDDDGNAAQKNDGNVPQKYPPKKQDSPAIKDFKKDLDAVFGETEEHFEDATSEKPDINPKNPTLLKEFSQFKKDIGSEIEYYRLMFICSEGKKHANEIEPNLRESVLRGMYQMAEGKITQPDPNKQPKGLLFCDGVLESGKKCNKEITNANSIAYYAKNPNKPILCFNCGKKTKS